MKFTRKLRKMGNLINFLFFRKTGEHVRNMFFLCPQLTEDQGEFSRDDGDFTEGERRGGDPNVGTRPHLMRWRILKGWRTSQSSHAPHTPTSTPTPPHSSSLHSTTLPHHPTPLPIHSTHSLISPFTHAPLPFNSHASPKP
jgi:hypothetical protein